MTDFLFEIGLEEVPARMIAGAQAELERRVVGLLVRERLVAGEIEAKSFSTPRRLAVVVRGVKERQEDLAEEMLGPSAKIAYKDGVATAAAVAFAKKAGVEIGALKTVTTPKGEYLSATAVKAGRAAGVVIEEELPKEVAGIYWAKTMYWRAGKAERFVRPVRWLVAMLGGETLDVEFAGQRSGNTTYGHRVLYGAEGISVGSAGEYEGALRTGYVIVDAEVRRQRIRKELDRVCRSMEGTRWREDHALVDKLTHLTEWPSVIQGGFQAEYLELPEEVLVTVMRDHQSYFAVEGKGGALAPHFLAVLNTEADERGQGVIRHGNERVLRARFNDARFFWEFDQRTTLNDRVALLDKVTFQKELGSYGAKAERVRVVAAEMAAVVEARGGKVDAGALDAAARLSKTDLTTELVKEFTELQGVVGGLYARAQGHAEAVAAAIYDQYRPGSMEDGVPRTIEGALLAIADKADTIAGMFGLGLEPTGSKDPFALRRAANGIVKILAETEIPLGLGEICFMAARGREAVVRTMEVFFAERLEFYLREAKGQAYDVVKAVLAVGADQVRGAVARAAAVSAVRSSADFEAVSAAFKRMSNILAQAKEKGLAAADSVDPGLFTDEAETWLFEQAGGVAARVAELREDEDYQGALEAMAGLRPQVDRFFEAVMVMAPDERVRGNRLALLGKVLGDFSGIADFSEIVVAG